MADDNLSPDEIRAALRITCADAGALLSDFHDDALPAPDRDRVRAHLDGCVACGVILEQLHITTVALRASGASREAVDPTTVDAVWAGIGRR